MGPTGETGPVGPTGESGALTTNLDLGQYVITVSDSASTVAKTVSLSGFTLKAGGIVVATFTYGNTASNMTLNINSTGAKSIYWQGAVIPADVIKAGDTLSMIYNGTYWVVFAFDDYGDLDASAKAAASWV